MSLHRWLLHSIFYIYDIFGVFFSFFKIVKLPSASQPAGKQKLAKWLVAKKKLTLMWLHSTWFFKLDFATKYCKCLLFHLLLGTE